MSHRMRMAAAGGAVSPPPPPPPPPGVNSPWDLMDPNNFNVGLTVADTSLAAPTFGNFTTTSSWAAANCTGAGTLLNPWICSSRHFRPNPGTIGSGIGGSTHLIATVGVSNLFFVNCRIAGSTKYSAGISNFGFIHCDVGLYDYKTLDNSNTPTVNRYTGSALSTSTYRQYWGDWFTRQGFYLAPGSSTWIWGSVTFKYLQPTTPASPVTGSIWTHCNDGGNQDGTGQFKVQAGTSGIFQRYTGSTWTNVDSQICPEMLGPNTGQSYGGVDLGSSTTNPVIWKSIVQAQEDGLYGGAFNGHIFFGCIVWPQLTRTRWNCHSDGLQTLGGGPAYIGYTYIIAGNLHFTPDNTKGNLNDVTIILKSDGTSIHDVLINFCLLEDMSNGPIDWYNANGNVNGTLEVRGVVFVRGPHTTMISFGAGSGSSPPAASTVVNTDNTFEDNSAVVISGSVNDGDPSDRAHYIPTTPAPVF